MKNQIHLIRTFSLLLILGLVTQACNKSVIPLTPSATTVSNPTPTPVISAGVSEIFWYSATLSRSNTLGTVNTNAEIYLSVNNQAETTDQVILSSGGASVTLPYNQTLVIGNGSYARYYLSGVPYQPGTTYTLSTVTSVGTAWATVTAPGGITCASNGSSCSWNFEGTNDSVYVENSSYSGTYNSLNTQADINSVFNIPASAYPSAGSYYVRTTCETDVNTVNNAMPGSSLVASDLLWSSVSH